MARFCSAPNVDMASSGDVGGIGRYFARGIITVSERSLCSEYGIPSSDDSTAVDTFLLPVWTKAGFICDPNVPAGCNFVFVVMTLS
jgi:hypothetical protein